MPVPQASKSAAVDDALGDDILLHVTPKWVDWYRDMMRRYPEEEDAQQAQDGASTIDPAANFGTGQ